MTRSKQDRTRPAPVAPRRPHSFTTHGITVGDDYAWLKDEDWQEVLRDPSILNADIRNYLEAENDYTESLLGHTAGFAKDAGRGNARPDQGRRFQRAVAGWPLRLFAQIPRGRPARIVRPHAARRRQDRDRPRWRPSGSRPRLLQVRRRAAFTRSSARGLERRHQGFGIFLDPGARLGRRQGP